MGGALVLEGVGVRFPDGTWALQDVDLEVGADEVLTVVGPSGAGKSTLLRLVCGLSTPTTGRVLIDGRDVTPLPPERRPVSMVFQGFALFPHLTARGNIAFGLRIRKERDVAARVEQVARTLCIDGLLDRRPSQLSGGERQRVALARALVRDPKVFCLDEPLSSLDPVLRADARLLLSGVLRGGSRCGLVVTHDQAEALTMGDRVAVLRAGRLEQVGSPAEVYDEPANSFVASFIGQPPMSLLRPPALGIGVNGAGVVGIRPEHVHLSAGDDATVAAVEHFGHEVHVVLDVAGQRLIARAQKTALRTGDRVAVRLDRERLRYFSD